YIDLDYLRDKLWEIPNFLRNQKKDDYFDENINKMIEILNLENNQIIGLPAQQKEVFFSIYFAKKIREIKDCTIIIGGLDIIKFSENQLETIIRNYEIDYIDYFVKRGVYTFFDKIISNALPLKNSKPRIISIENKNYGKYTTLPLVKGLPEYNKEHLELYKIKPKKIQFFFPQLSERLINKLGELEGGNRPKVIPYTFQIGCSNNCAYCGFTKDCAFLGVDKISSEISRLSKSYNTNKFYFLNTNLSFSKRYTEQLLNKYQHELDIKWSDTANTSMTDPSLIRKFSKAGCIQIFLGLCTASKKLQDYVYGKKNYNFNNHISKCFKSTNTNGIWLVTDLICGLPYENNKDILQTKNFLLENKDYINGIVATKFRLMKTSPFVENPKRYGLKIYKRKDSIKNLNNAYDIDRVRYGGYEFNEKFGLDWKRKHMQI
ncbi:MAG: radical SAM protein, partial [bacterium]